LNHSFSILFTATSLAVLGGFYISVGVATRLDLPTYPGDTLMGVGVALLGYAVARHNALIQVRAIERDFWYSLLAVGLLTAFYYVGALILYFGEQVSFLSLMLVIAIAISSHALYDGVRVALDRLFYQEQFRQLRTNLRSLARDAGTGGTLEEQLQAVCRALCRALRIRQGVIALRTGNGFEVKVAHRIQLDEPSFPQSALSATEIVHLSQPDPQGMTLLVPLCANELQLGALVLGAKESDQHYSEEDLDLIDDLADQIANVIHTAQLQEKSAQAMNQLVAEFRERERTLQQQMQKLLGERELETRPILEGVSEREFRSLVEDGLRRLHEYTYLGEHALAQMHIVFLELGRQEGAYVTHIDRGKALNRVLLQALQKLRPEGTEPPPHQVPSREWHQFIVLHDAYVLGELNRDIMSRLYISEGTFNRTRRRALRGVARALMEMEREAQKR
jgi:GAF domain-containing protein